VLQSCFGDRPRASGPTADASHPSRPAAPLRSGV